MLKLLPLLLLTACGAAWTEAPAAVDPVAQHAFPVAGKCLLEISAVFRQLCPTLENPACAHARDVLNSAIDAYNTANQSVIESQ